MYAKMLDVNSYDSITTVISEETGLAPAATLNGVFYGKFIDAYNAAQNGDTITMFADYEISSRFNVGKSIMQTTLR